MYWDGISFSPFVINGRVQPVGGLSVLVTPIGLTYSYGDISLASRSSVTFMLLTCGPSIGRLAGLRFFIRTTMTTTIAIMTKRPRTRPITRPRLSYDDPEADVATKQTHNTNYRTQAKYVFYNIPVASHTKPLCLFHTADTDKTK